MTERWREVLLEACKDGRRASPFAEVRNGWITVEEEVNALTEITADAVKKLQKFSNILRYAGRGVPWVLTVFLGRIMSQRFGVDGDVIVATTIEPDRIESIQLLGKNGRRIWGLSIPINHIEDPFIYPMVVRELLLSVYGEEDLAGELAFLVFGEAYTMSAKEFNLLYDKDVAEVPIVSQKARNMLGDFSLDRKSVLSAMEKFVMAIPPVEFEDLSLLLNALWMAYLSKGRRRELSQLFLTTVKLIEVKRLWEENNGRITFSKNKGAP